MGLGVGLGVGDGLLGAGAGVSPFAIGVAGGHQSGGKSVMLQMLRTSQISAPVMRAYTVGNLSRPHPAPQLMIPTKDLFSPVVSNGPPESPLHGDFPGAPAQSILLVVTLRPILA